MKTLEFDFVAWKDFTKKLDRLPYDAEHRRFFKGAAYPFAFPPVGVPKRWYWVLNGEAVLWDDSVIEFTWRNGTPMTFNEFLASHAQEWARMMDAESKAAPISIKCCAGLLL